MSAVVAAASVVLLRSLTRWSGGEGTATRAAVASVAAAKLPPVGAASSWSNRGTAGGRLTRVRVLVVEDEQRLADVLARGLGEAGHEVSVRHSGPDGLLMASTEAFDVVVLDWMLPGQDGPSVCRALRGRGVKTPVLMLTARHAVPDRVAGLDAGAD